MNVALLSSARAWRGSGTSLANVARGLAARGHNVHILATAPAVTAAFAAQGLRASELSIRDTGLREARMLARTLGGLGVEVLLAEKPRDLRLGALVSLARRLALVYRHNVGGPAPPRDPIVRLAYRRVRMTIFLTRTAEAQAGDIARFMLRPPRRVIYEGVDVARFRPDRDAAAAFRRRHGLGERPFVLAVGALEREKRYDWLFGALAGLGPVAPPLVACGAGGAAGQIRDQAAALRIDVRLLGFLSPEELVGAYNAAACLVHACAVETFGLAIAEAMACGRAVVAAAAGGGSALPEVLGDTGVLTPADDPGAFATALARLVADPDRGNALGIAARQRAVKLFSLERMGREYAEAIEACA